MHKYEQKLPSYEVYLAAVYSLLVIMVAQLEWIAWFVFKGS